MNATAIWIDKQGNRSIDPCIAAVPQRHASTQVSEGLSIIRRVLALNVPCITAPSLNARPTKHYLLGETYGVATETSPTTSRQFHCSTMWHPARQHMHPITTVTPCDTTVTVPLALAADASRMHHDLKMGCSLAAAAQ